MIKYRYLLILFLLNLFIKSAYSQSCTTNNTGSCTGPLSVTSSGITATNSGTITSTTTAASGQAFGIKSDSASSNLTVTNTGTISVSAQPAAGAVNAIELPHSAHAIVTNASNFVLTNSGTITATTSATNGSSVTVGSRAIINNGTDAIIINENTGTISATSTPAISPLSGSLSRRAYALENYGSNLTFTNSGTLSGTATRLHGIGFADNGSSTGKIGATIINSGTIIGTASEGTGTGILLSFNNSTIKNTNTGTISGSNTGISNSGTGISINNSGTISGSNTGISNSGTGISINNSGTITGGTSSINNSGVINLTLNQGSTLIGTITNSGTLNITSNVGLSNSITNSGIINLTLNQGSKLIGTFTTNSGTLNITSNVGASKSYAYSGIVTSLTDSNNRPSALGSAVAINIGSMEISGEHLYQKTANITDAVDRNIKNNKDTWVEPYYSESTRDSGGDSSQIRQFKNNKQGINAGFKVANSAKPLQVIFNVDQTKNNIDSSEHIINSDSVMIGLVAPTYKQYAGFNVSVKGLLGYANSKTDRKILDNTSSTGERTLTGEYDSYYAVVGSALSKNYNLDKDLSANLTLGVDLTSEFRDSYSENLYFKYNSLELIQLQPRIQSEFIKTTGKDSNVFLTAGVGAREILSGKTQKYSMNNTGVSFTAPNSGDYYASLAAGTNMNVAANVNFYALVSAKMSEKDTETYQASIGLKGTF